MADLKLTHRMSTTWMGRDSQCTDAIPLRVADLDTIHQMDDGRWCVWSHALGNTHEGEHIVGSSRAAVVRKIQALRDFD